MGINMTAPTANLSNNKLPPVPTQNIAPPSIPSAIEAIQQTPLSTQPAPPPNTQPHDEKKSMSQASTVIVSFDDSEPSLTRLGAQYFSNDSGMD